MKVGGKMGRAMRVEQLEGYEDDYDDVPAASLAKIKREAAEATGVRKKREARPKKRNKQGGSQDVRKILTNAITNMSRTDINRSKLKKCEHGEINQS